MANPTSPSGIPVSRLVCEAPADGSIPHILWWLLVMFLFTEIKRKSPCSPWARACDRQPGTGYVAVQTCRTHELLWPIRARPLGSRRFCEASFLWGIKVVRTLHTSVIIPGLRVEPPASVTHAVVAYSRGYSSLAVFCLGQAMLLSLVMAAGGGVLFGLFPIACWASFVSVFSKPHQVSSATKP